MMIKSIGGGYLQNTKQNYNVSLKKDNTSQPPMINQAISNICYKPLSVIKFGQASKEEELKEFNPESLTHVKVNEEFDSDELTELDSDIDGDCWSALWNLSSGSEGERIRYYENNKSLIPWHQDSIVNDCKYKGLSEEETQEVIKNETEKYGRELEDKKQKVITLINNHTPCKRSHNVWRIESLGWDNMEYFNKLKSLKPDEEIVMASSTPLYVSTSPKVITQNYGGFKNSVLFKINIPEGSKLLKMPSNDGIEQMLMKPGARFKVTDNDEYKNNFHIVTLEYMPEEE